MKIRSQILRFNLLRYRQSRAGNGCIYVITHNHENYKTLDTTVVVLYIFYIIDSATQFLFQRAN